MSLRDWAPTRKFFAHLERRERELADELGHCGRCVRCGGKLHRADYRRKGSWAGEQAGQSSCRRIICCAARECRKRLTPPSFCVASRKWYPLFVIVVAAARPPPTHTLPQALLQLQRQPDIAATVGATIGLLVHAVLGPMIAPFEGPITILRDWHCCEP